MSRGDQRERDRAKRQLKDAQRNNATNQRDGTPQQRNDDDKLKLQAKVAAKKAKQEAEAAAAAAGTKAPVVRKKVSKKPAENLDDLLSAGLSKGKKSKK